VFGYLKRFPGLSALLRLLAHGGLPSLVVVDGLAQETARRASTPSLCVTGEPVDLAAAACECSLALGHGTHGTTAALLRAGRPALLVPLQLEQFWVARRAVQAGFAQIASVAAPEGFARGIERLLGDPRFAVRARELAARYAGFDPGAELARIAERIEALAAG
jgi:UDP:flavonoid glycosyltransferase YjiC (YdhE family)